MKFHICSVILWSWDASFQPRVIPFEPGMVNVLTGNARTGKSAIIPIIDYCLCSRSCAIPRKVIRAACEWFGVVVETSEGQKLLARKNPGEAGAVEEMFVLEAPEIQIPRRIYEPNARADKVKRSLDKLAGLSHLDFAGGDVVNKVDHRIGFRDLMAFVFQPQNVVANRDILFYRSEKLEHKLKLSRNVLPYVLGAVTPEILAAQHEIERLSRELRRKTRDLERARSASSRWEAQMSAHLAQAEELGLYTGDIADNLSAEAMLGLLRSVATKTVDDFNADSSTITGAVERQIELEAAEDKLAAEMSELKSRQEELTRLRDGAGGYRDALMMQQDRLAVSEWLSENGSEGQNCPICGHEMASHKEELQQLRSHMAEIEVAASQIGEMPLAVDREVQHIRHSMDDVAEKLRDIRRQKKSLESESAEAGKRQFRALSVAHFLGQLSQALSLYEELQSDGELSNEIKNLRDELEQLTATVDSEGIKRRLNGALARVSSYISQHMPRLDNDHASNAASLDVSDLTLRIDGIEGQSALWSIGSGSNHLSYHVSTLLALHRFFLEEPSSVVPGLLILDQPSQVYFPEKIHRGAADEDQPWENDDDVAAVRKIFELLGSVVGKSGERLQVIVLDHAPDSVWGELTSVTLAEDWHTGTKLVPSEWPGAIEAS
jgi:hypothetical protein